MEEERKEKVNRRENWITEVHIHVCVYVCCNGIILSLLQGIVVKVLHKKLGDRFYKKKGVVEAVKDTFAGIVKMLDSGDKIKIDQAHLETVIPAIGEPLVHVECNL